MWTGTRLQTLDFFQNIRPARVPRAAGISASWAEPGELLPSRPPRRVPHAAGKLLRLRPCSRSRISPSSCCGKAGAFGRQQATAALPGRRHAAQPGRPLLATTNDNRSTDGADLTSSSSSSTDLLSENGAGTALASSLSSSSSSSSSQLEASPGPDSAHEATGGVSGAALLGAAAIDMAAASGAAGPAQPGQHAAGKGPPAVARQQQAAVAPDATRTAEEASSQVAGLEPPSEQQQEQQPAEQPPTEQAPAPVADAPARKGKLFFIGSIAAVIISGVANRVLYKMAITPLSNYVFFMAQLQTFGYCFVYFAILALRLRAGKVRREQLGVPLHYKALFTKIGIVEAVSSLLGFLGAANLPGVVLPLLSQTVMFWQVLLAKFMLHKALGRTQLVGVALVVAGVVLAAWPSAGGGSPLANVHPGYAWMFVFSMLFPALDTIYKERLFRGVREETGSDLDLFIVNSYGSLAQAAFVFALLPVMTALKGLTLADMPGYAASGFQCLRGLTPACGSDCTGAPLLPLAYVATNLVFNIAALSLIRTAGNVTMSLVMSAMVPVTIWAFTINLPYLAPAPPLGPTFLTGAGVLLLGLLAYNAPLWLPPLRKRLQLWLAEGESGGSGRGVTSVVAG